MSISFPEIAHPFPKIDTQQMIEVDRLMIEAYGIELIQMMENAGRCLAILARDRFLEGDAEAKKIAVLAGTGGNGGGALVAARRLANWGAKVEVYMSASEEKMTPVPAKQRKILEGMDLPIKSATELPVTAAFDLLIDGIIGYRVKGHPYGLPEKMISWINHRPEAVLSLDTPSGLDLSSGIPFRPTVKADATLTLALPKIGLFSQEAIEVVGELFLGDISVPPQLYEEKTLELKIPNLFRSGEVVRLY